MSRNFNNCHYAAGKYYRAKKCTRDEHIQFRVDAEDVSDGKCTGIVQAASSIFSTTNKLVSIRVDREFKFRATKFCSLVFNAHHGY